MQSEKERINTLIELNDELENYFRNTIIPQLFVDAHLILRKFTPPAMKQFKLKAEHIGQPLANVKENFRFPTILENIQQVIDTSEILEKEIQTTDMRWYQMNVLPYIVEKGNKTNGVIITFMDITARIKDLKEQEKLIAEHELLLDTIAHDIKNPLTSLSLTIELLKKLPEKGMAKFPVLLGNVENSLVKMKDIISDLVQSRWQDQRYQAHEELLDLQNIMEDVRLTLAPQIQDAKAILKFEVGLSEITFSRRKLRSVLYNLLNNALKYSAEERRPEILIKSFQEDGYLVISVTDNGIGIEKQHLNSIFEKYQRINRDIEGNGVGLYLIRQILETAGGKITVTSLPGEGSVFTVFLPIEQDTK
ncbi:sensor histidine kinase [Pedobacter metabolipauper]|uniref:histidine kinase n=1 Tax=Pedobacter metabolipauper TaxID=425513 RepID=A0A4R6SYS7_9SPHI|nr:ATP-binding protein [Pedobacter metabolipauper]TDQ11217.1 two-component system phosphate regulon sensor histidine kinase PhoR [Pedobacter metabolipauper]